MQSPMKQALKSYRHAQKRRKRLEKKAKRFEQKKAAKLKPQEEKRSYSVEDFYA